MLELQNGGGFGVTGSGTPGAIPVWVTTTQLGNSVMAQTSASDITIGTDPDATATETLRFIGGIITDTGAGHDNVIIGRGANARAQASARNVSIGTGASWTGAGNTIENVLIGFQLANLTTDVGSCTIIGSRFSYGASFPQGNVTVVGAGNTINNAFSGPGVGAGSSWQGSGAGFGNQQTTGAVNNWVAVGRSVDLTADGATAVGDNVTASHANGITLGRNAISIAANMLLAGAQNVGITSMLLGEGDTVAAPANFTWRQTNASGTDAPGGDVLIIASRGTGNVATQGRIILQTGTPGASGVALQAAATRLEVLPAQNAAGAAVNFVGTNSPGAAVGTLNNAPTAGDPEWVPMLFNGNIRKFPVWA